ncbi:hypothetical protein [Bradyrhizobium sp. CIR3A]|uniref:hypothetical protein n=1 Tax=Bradyrhizobium sp. CIR3A TaxID=2663838 RepID=UPI00160604BD|nr:hypothetical protein [Bradyrhizobium sp. CIR3A]MBB4263418.1 hypothetical protein [Bradyrhizobium sp. CIR3A]
MLCFSEWIFGTILRTKPFSAAKVKRRAASRRQAIQCETNHIFVAMESLTSAGKIEPDHVEHKHDSLFILPAAHPGVAVNRRDNAESPSS